MAGHSRSKNGVASLAYVPATYIFTFDMQQNVDGRNKSGHDRYRVVLGYLRERSAATGGSKA